MPEKFLNAICLACAGGAALLSVPAFAVPTYDAPDYVVVDATPSAGEYFGQEVRMGPDGKFLAGTSSGSEFPIRLYDATALASGTAPVRSFQPTTTAAGARTEIIGYDGASVYVAHVDYQQTGGISVMDATTGVQTGFFNDPHGGWHGFDDGFLAGDRIVIDSYRIDRVHVLDKTTGVRVYSDLVAPSGPVTNFGILGKAVDDGRILIGDSYTTAGRAHLYDFASGAYQRTFINPNFRDADDPSDFDDRFGHALVLAGDIAVISAPAEDRAGVTNVGAAYAFDVTTGALLHSFQSPVGHASTGFGSYMATDGQTLAISSFAGGGDPARIYLYDMTSFAMTGILEAPAGSGVGSGNQFGVDIAFWNDLILVGAADATVGGLANAGAVYVYDLGEVEMAGVPTPAAAVLLPLGLLALRLRYSGETSKA